MGGQLKSAAKVAGGVLGGAALVSFGKSSVDAATESAVANARLEQVMRSMGDTTGQAAKDAEAYASSMSKRIGVDDEVILAGQAQLATFGSVSSEAARMSGVFDRATAAGADLAAAGFGSIDSNAVQLGKALEDPTKGMTALAKSGVTFTDSQKEQIKAMQESGDLLGAQQIVLAAVEKQVGGTAEATVTSQQKAALAFGEVQEQVGGKLLPVLSTVLDLFTRFSGPIMILAGVIIGLVAAMKIYNLVMGIMAIVNSTAAATTWAWTAALLANPLVWIVVGIMALVAALVLAYMKIGWFRDAVDAAWAGVKVAFGWIIDIAKEVFNWIKDNWPLLLAIITGPIGIAVLLITKNFDTIKEAVSTAVGWVMDRFDDLKGFLSRVADGISGVLDTIVTAIKMPIAAATEVYNWVSEKFQALLDFLKGLKEKFTGAIGDLAGLIKDPINAVIRAWNAIEFGIPGIDVGPVHWGGITISTPNIPELAKGGVVLRTGMALVHEGETFSGVGKASKASTVNITVNTTGLGADAPQIQKAVVRALRQYTSRNGALDIPVQGMA
jgi:hypothetical protein